MPYDIGYSQEAIEQLEYLTKRQQQTVLDTIDEQLTHEPTRETRNRKRLRENRIATWELRIGSMRVFYDVSEEPIPFVNVVTIGIKKGNRLFVGGREYKL
ncbi:MAG: hypothetical protein WD894_17210 [Pirellulales bacterium]